MLGRTTGGRLGRWLTMASGVTLALAACSSAASPAGGAGFAQPADQRAPSSREAASAAPAMAPAAPDAGSINVGIPGQTDLLVIKTGSLELGVNAIDSALAQASAKIAGLNGYVSASQRSGDGDQAAASVTYRIPARNWDSALGALRSLADKVLGEQTQTVEVTGQVIDLAARITNLQATEKALQAIMTQATKISDVLAVQQQLTDVRGQIEQLTAEKQHLQEQAAFGTLTVGWTLATPAVVQAQGRFDPAKEVDRASASLVGLGQALATAGIWFGIVWLPVLLLLGIVSLVGLLVARRVRGRRRHALAT